MNRLPSPAPKVGRAYSLHMLRDTTARCDIIVTTPKRWKTLPESRSPSWVALTFRCLALGLVVAVKLTMLSEGAYLDHSEGQCITPSIN